MDFIKLGIDGTYLIKPKILEDSRGHFFRTYCADEFEHEGLHIFWKQANHSFTQKKGAFRGIHYQIAPYGEYKLIRCVSGSVLDFGVDLRNNSQTLFRHVQAELSEENNFMILLPPGVGHAFQTLKENTSLTYLHSQVYKPTHEGGVLYNDKKINLPLPLPVTDISDKDRQYALIPDDFTGIAY